jgi:hypothetical protein
MEQTLKVAVASGGYVVDHDAVAEAMMARGRAPIALKTQVAGSRPGLEVLVTAEVVDGCAAGADQDQPVALEGTA